MAASGSFPTTCWSRLVPGAASGDGGPSPQEAIETLARAYWRPIHAWLRRSLSRADEDARELTQDFFVWVMESGFLARADRERGRFRAFLKTALRHYAIDSERRRGAGKRGGGVRMVPLLGEGGDSVAYALPAAPEPTPDEVLDAAWRQEVVQRALRATQDELEGGGRAVVFAVFRDYFLDPGDDGALDYRAVAQRHGISVTDVSNFLQRAKRLYRDHLRRLVRETVGGAEDLDGELGWLLADGR